MPRVHIPTQLVDLWHKIKRDSSVHTPSISQDDIVVFIIGPTGSGKSWFTKEATKSDLVKVSRDFHPCTGKVQAIRCELTDEAKKDMQGGIKGIVLVDTPSFLTECEHPNAEKELRTWLDRTSYQPRHVGVIYMHRVETDPALESMQSHLQEFSTIPRISHGWHLPQRVHIVVSYDRSSGKVSEAKINERRSKLCTEMDSLKRYRWKPSIHPRLFEGEPEVAWGAIEELFRN